MITTETPDLKPQFFCGHCRKYKFEIDRLQTGRAGHYICAECENKRNKAIKRLSSKIERWNHHE